MAEIKNINTENTDGLLHIELGKPVTYNGEEYTALDFDFEGLTGEDGENVYAELRAHGIAVLVETMTPEYLIGMAARACKQSVGRDIFLRMRLKDYVRIKKAARDFLRDAD